MEYSNSQTQRKDWAWMYSETVNSDKSYHLPLVINMFNHRTKMSTEQIIHWWSEMQM